MDYLGPPMRVSLNSFLYLGVLFQVGDKKAWIRKVALETEVSDSVFWI